MNSIKYLLVFLVIFTSCVESNDSNSNINSVNKLESTEELNLTFESRYSRYQKMLYEYEVLLDQLAGLNSAIDEKNLDALSAVLNISEKANKWVEKWKKTIREEDLSTDEINLLIQRYEDLLKKYDRF